MNSCSLKKQTLMWILEVSLSSDSGLRTGLCGPWALPLPALGSAAFLLLCKPELPCPGCWEGEGLPWDTAAQGALKTWAKLCPQDWPLGQAVCSISGCSMARQHLVAAAVIPFLWAPFCSQSKAPHCQPSCPAQALVQDGIGLCYCNKN